MRIFIVGWLLVFMSACSPLFVIRAAYEQGKILSSRVPIEQALLDPKISAQDKQKLSLVLKAKEYCAEIGLETGGSFSTFSQLDSDSAAWIISASRKESFAAYTWWFPIVGSVPYKGYFSRQQALDRAADLNAQGWETWTRPTAAFSTLGWFNDPLLSSTLSLSAAEVVNTVIHESVHSTVWIPGSVSFNESMANYIAARASLDFYNWLDVKTVRDLSQADLLILRQQAVENFSRELVFADAMETLWAELSALYSSDESVETKLIKRQEVFQKIAAAFKARHPGLGFMKELNNAEILQRRLYLRHLSDFDLALKQLNNSCPDFISKVKAFKDLAGTVEEENFEAFFEYVRKSAGLDKVSSSR